MLFILNKSYEVVGILNLKGDLSKITTYFNDKYTQDLGTGAETFQFSVAANSTQAQHLVSGNFVAFKENGEFKLFNIINIEETHEEIFMKEVYCEMASIELINKIVRPMEVLNSSLRKFLESILEDTEWQLGKMDIGFTQVYDFKVTDYKSVYELIQEYAVGTYGAEISYRVEIENGVVVGKYIDCYAERGKDNGFRFYYGSNLSSVVKTVDSSNLATALIGVGKNGLTFKSVEAPDKPLNSDFIANETAFEQWNVNGNHIFGVHNADTESPQELLRLTRIALEERANPQIKYEMKAELLGKNVGIGDTVYVVDHEFNPPLHLSARVNQLITSKTDPNSNEVVLANFKEVNSNITEEMRSLASQLEGYVDSQFPIGGDKIQDGAIGKQQFSKEYHTELIADAVYASLVETEELIAGKADIGDLTAINAKIENLKVEKADITELHAQKAEIEELVATKADIGQLNATNAQIENLKANKADISDLHATNATIGELQANKADIGELNAVKGEITHLKSEVAEIGVIKGDVADIEHILAGNITADNIQTGAITAGSGIIADGAIGNAQISSIDAGKIEAGTIDTSKVTIQGSNGHLRLKGNRMQVFEGTGNQAKERVSVGDVNGDGSVYGLRVRGADGQTILLDENGVTSEGITDGSITNDKISDDANIDGAKLNINSVVSKINEDGTETIQGTKIEVDGTTLNTKLSTITTKQTEDSERITQAQSQITANTNAIKLKVDEQTYTTDKKDMTAKLEKNTSEITAMKGEIALKVEQTDIENAINEATLSRADFIARNFLSTPLIVSDSTLPIYTLSGIPNPPIGSVFGGFSQERNIIKNNSISSNGSAWAIIVGYEFYKNTTDNDKKNKIRDIIKKVADFMANNVSIGRFNSMNFNFIDTNYKYDSTSKSWVKSNYKEIYLSTLWLQVKAMVYAYEILKDSTYSSLCFNILDSLFNTHFYINTKVASNELPTHLEWSSYEYLACDNLSTNYRFVASTKQYANQMGYYIHQAIPDVIRVFGDNERTTPKGDIYKPSDILVGLKKYLKNAYDTQNITAKPLGLPYGYFHRVENGSGGYDYIPQNWNFIEDTWGDGWFVGDVVTYTIYAFAASGLTDIAREYADNYYKLRVNVKDGKWSTRFNASELIFYDRMDFYTGSHLSDDDSISITYTALYYEILKQIGKNEHIDACCYTLAKHQINNLDNKNIDGGYPWDISRDDSSLEFKSFGEIINSQFYKNLNITSFTEIDNKFAEIKVTTDSISQNVTNLSQTVSTKADGSTVSSLNSKVSSLETSVNGISGKVSSLEKTTTTLGTQVDAANTTANNAQNTANTNKSNITNLQGEVSTVKNNVASLEVTTSGISQKVSSVESTTATLSGKVNTANNNATNALNTANNTNSKVDNMQIGGRNLLLNSGNFKNTSHWSLNGGSNLRVETKDGFSCLSATGSVKHSVIKLEPSTTYMYWTEIMFNADMSVTNSVPLHYWVNSMPSRTSRGTVTVVSGSGTAKANKWHRIVLKIDTGTLVSGDTHIELTPFIYRGSMTESWWLKYIQVEKGTKPSDWKPAPEDVDGAINSVDGKVTSLQGTVNTTNSKVATLETNLNGITQRVSSTESTTATLTTKVNNAQNTADSAKSTATTASTNATNALNTANSAKSSIDNLKIGGRNLIRKDNVGMNNTTGSFNATNNTWTLTATAGAGGTWGCGLVIKNKDALIPYGKSYVLSFEIKVPRACTWNYDINNYASTGTSWGGNDNDNISKRAASSKSLTANVWTKCWIRYENSNTNNTSKVDIYDNTNFGVLMNSETSNMTFYIRNIQGEIGTVPTEWTPAPEDVEKQISDVKTEISNTKSKVATIETNLSGITSRVSNVETNQTTTNGKVSSLETRMSTAESKITETAITNTVKKNFYTKSETDSQITSKGYQTSSQVQQTVDALQMKFEQSGGYNLLKNSAFKNGTNGWSTLRWDTQAGGNNNIGVRNIGDDWTPTNRNSLDASVTNLPNTSINKPLRAGFDSHKFKVRPNTTYTLNCLMAQHRTRSITIEMLCYDSADNRIGTSNYAVTLSSVKSGGRDRNNWTKVKHTWTTPSNAVTCHLRAYMNEWTGESSSAFMWICEPLITEGNSNLPWTPNADEVYTGITTIDKEGITVNQSNISTYTTMDASSFRVENNTGGTIAEFSQNSQIPNLSAGIINANEIYSPNMCTKSPMSGSIKYIVNGSTGNDNNNGTTYSTPFKTVAKAVSMLNTQQDRSVDIEIYGSVTGFDVKGINGTGAIRFYFSDDAIVNGAVIIGGITNTIGFHGGSSDKPTFKNGISVYRCRDVEIGSLTFRGTNSSGNNIYLEDVTFTRIISCDLGGLDTQLLCAIQARRSNLWIYNCRGSKITDVVAQSEFSIAYAPRTGTSNVPDYSNAFLCNYDGAGRIHNWSGGNFVKTPSKGWNPAYTPTQKTQTWSFNKIWSDETLHGWSDRQELIQGYASTWNTGRWTGYMQFTDGMAAIRNTISGGTNFSGRLYVQRRTSSGNSTGSKLCLYASDGTLITNSTTINRGQGVWVTLNSAIISKIASGAITYFYLKADSNNSATYFKCESNAKIEITYTK